MAGKKGQVAIEFLMYAGLFMIIAIAAYVLTSFTERGEVSIRESQLINAFGYKFASAPTIAYKGGEGFVYDISFPKKLEGKDYNVTYICSTSGGERSCYIQVAWPGTYQEMNYPYTIAPARYVRGYDIGTSGCLQNVPTSVGTAIRLDPSSSYSDGHLIFRNIGIEEGYEYPTIEMYCEVTE